MRFTISEFSNFKMVDNLPINDQIHHFQNLVQKIYRVGLILYENYQVSYLTENFHHHKLILNVILEESKTILPLDLLSKPLE